MNPKPSLRISVSKQRLEVVSPDGKVLQRYRISTSSGGTGIKEGSFRTPTGRFRIAAKHGRNAPSGMIFRARKATGRRARQGEPGDLILSRILWLEGLERANANTKARFIYLHGTNHEAKLGRAVSHGCIRLANADIIALFALVPRGSRVDIA
jgi:L,D-transpeptidase YbiS